MSYQPAAIGTSADSLTLTAGHSSRTAEATQPAAAPRASKLEHYPSTSSADESIGELPAGPREPGTLSRTLSSEPASPLSTGRSQEFFSARDEPDPEVTPVAGDAVKSPNPKFKKREPPAPMPVAFAHLFGKIRHGRIEQVKEVLDGNAAVPLEGRDDHGNTMLHVACSNGHMRIVKLLLRAGAAVNSENLKGQTPVDLAFQLNFNEVGEYIMSKIKEARGLA